MAAFDLFGRRWTLRILWELRDGPLGFRPLQQRCGGMSSSVLQTRLAELREARLVQHATESGHQLTALGHDALRALRPMLAWSRNWAAALDDVPPLPAEDYACPTCPLSYPTITPEAVASMVRTYPKRYRRALQQVHHSAVRRRPDPDTWSVLEYLCHVRDVYDVYHDRMIRTITEQHPVLDPMRNQWRAESGRYNEQDPRQVLAAIDRHVRRFAGLVETIEPQQWSRTAQRLPNEKRTLLWLARQAAHEGLHHLDDIKRIGATVHGV